MSLNTDIPKSFTTSVDRPFEPIGVRELSGSLYTRNNQHLTDDQIKELIKNPAAYDSAIQKEQERLSQLSNTENKRLQSEFEAEKIYNLSLLQLAQRTTITLHDILDDLVNFNVADGTRGFIQIFTQSDRLMYIGLIIVVLTFLIILLKLND